MDPRVGYEMREHKRAAEWRRQIPDSLPELAADSRGSLACRSEFVKEDDSPSEFTYLT